MNDRGGKQYFASPMASGGDEEEEVNGTTAVPSKVVYTSLSHKPKTKLKTIVQTQSKQTSQIDDEAAPSVGEESDKPKPVVFRERRPKKKPAHTDDKQKTRDEGETMVKTANRPTTPSTLSTNEPVVVNSPRTTSPSLNPSAVPFAPSQQPQLHLQSQQQSQAVRPAVRVPVQRPNPLLGKGASAKLRAEVEGLRRRYQNCGPFGCENDNVNGTILEFKMPIEDPDFPFDVAALQLKVLLPPKYPDEDYATFTVLNSDVPDGVKTRIQNRMRDASEGMPKGELNVKPLLRVLERNLEKWMVALPTVISSPSSSVKIIPAGNILVSPAPSPAVTQPVTIPEMKRDPKSLSLMADEVARSLEMVAVGVPIKKTMSALGRYQPPEHVRIDSISASSIAGTIKMEPRQITMENLALLVPILLGVSLRCGRCRKETPLTDLRPGVDRIIPCAGCKQYMEVSFIRDAIHSNNRTIGYLRCKRTSPTDLLPGTFQVTCSECDPTEPLASSIKVENVQIGEEVSFSCRNCHENISFCLDGISWNEIPALMAPSASAIKPTKLPTKVGEPLPEYGACSHYRKSFRWFRFPCCGRAYPCDECHAVDQKHEAEWASRQICGYCSREFSTSQKYCECGEVPGGSPRHTAHWEGGKGARDQNMMSRKDRKKYRNQEKTLSAKARSKE